jgi:hypothetical protein
MDQRHHFGFSHRQVGKTPRPLLPTCGSEGYAAGPARAGRRALAVDAYVAGCVGMRPATLKVVDLPLPFGRSRDLAAHDGEVDALLRATIAGLDTMKASIAADSILHAHKRATRARARFTA